MLCGSNRRRSSHTDPYPLVHPSVYIIMPGKKTDWISFIGRRRAAPRRCRASAGERTKERSNDGESERASEVIKVNVEHTF